MGAKKKIILFSAVFVFLAVLIGKETDSYVFPAIQNTVLRQMLSGFTILAAITLIVEIAYSVFSNVMMMCYLDYRMPYDIEQIDDIGIKTPVDFAYFASYVFDEPSLPAINFMETERPVFFQRTYNRSIKLFNEKFGRNPLGWEHKSWDMILCAEIAQIIDIKNTQEIMFSDIAKCISPEVENYCDF